MIDHSILHPYEDVTFFGFFAQLFLRILGFLSGEITSQLASDEIQILVLVGVAVSSAFVGTFLILRKMTMLANSLSHTILLGIVIAFIFTPNGLISNVQDHSHSINIHIMLVAALATGIITTFLTEFLSKATRLQEDASTGIVFTTMFALGVILVTLWTRNAHIGVEVVMGNVDALHIDDLKLVYLVLAVNLISFILFFKEFKMTTFDSGLSKVVGISTVFFNYLLMVQVSATVIGAFRAVGVLMVLSFITGPALAARLLTNDLKKMIGLAVLFGSASSIIGVAFSRHLLSVYGVALSTSGLVVCSIVLLFLLTLCFVYGKRLLHNPKKEHERFEYKEVNY